MTRRVRKLLGTFLIIGFVTVYALVVMVIAQMPIVQTAGRFAQMLFFLAAGLAWTLPLLPLIRWMERRGALESA